MVDQFEYGVPSPVNSNQAENNRITLQVGDRRFITFRDTLTGESGYFKARLSDRWNDREKDGSFFIDANPDLFNDVLSYLRSGMFPLFFDAATERFDYSRYAALLGEARYFDIPRLEDWISEARYHSIVRIKIATNMISDMQAGEDMNTLIIGADTKINVSTTWDVRKVYICPRDIDEHRGDRRRCGKACEKARVRDGVGIKYEEQPVLRAAFTSKRLIFDPEACFDGGEDTK